MNFKSTKSIFFFLLIGLCFISTCKAGGLKSDGQIKTSLRMIGHKLLLHYEDSSSRVLPIEKEGDQFIIPFESDFKFNPAVLVGIIDGVIWETELSNKYLLEVKTCEDESVVYSYEMRGEGSADIVPCGPRDQPLACNRLYFTFLDIKEEASYDMNYLFFLIVPLLLIAFVFYRKKKKSASINADLINIGKYQFDKRNMMLSIERQETELTSKEADLLFLLHSSANSTLERDHILNVVWGDEGDYVGRTLDVFISKLRKKLEADPSIRIANIRGVGYKLVLNAPQ